MVYNGTISGTGESRTRENEITADDIATFRARIFGFDYGVIDIYNPFFAEVNGNEVKIGKGMMFAYGYIGYLPKALFSVLTKRRRCSIILYMRRLIKALYLTLLKSKLRIIKRAI